MPTPAGVTTAGGPPPHEFIPGRELVPAEWPTTRGLDSSATIDENGRMVHVANVTSSVLFVTDLERSISVYSDVFMCEIALHHGEVLFS